MNFCKIIIFIFLLKLGDLSAQDKMDIGQHIYYDKLTYITLKEKNEFEYLKYYNWSPLTIKEKRDSVNSSNQICATNGYVSGAKGKGIYRLKNGKLILVFTEFKKYMDNETNYNTETKTMNFSIAKFIN